MIFSSIFVVEILFIPSQISEPLVNLFSTILVVQSQSQPWLFCLYVQWVALLLYYAHFTRAGLQQTYNKPLYKGYKVMMRSPTNQPGFHNKKGSLFLCFCFHHLANQFRNGRSHQFTPRSLLGIFVASIAQDWLQKIHKMVMGKVGE